MKRLIQRRLIVPRGDTGSFTIPIQGSVGEGDMAVFSIYDPMIRTTVCEKRIDLTSSMENLEIFFEAKDTVELAPKKYLWDIKIYKNPTKYRTLEGEIIETSNELDDIPIDAEEINSYYSAFSLPICEIKEVAQNV